MKLSLNEGEKYPHLFIRTRAETVEIYGEDYAQTYFDPGFEVPDELAQKWIAAREAWIETEEEIDAFMEAHGLSA